MGNSRRLTLRFPSSITAKPIVFRLAKDYDLEFNILKASISPDQEGLMVIELNGERVMEGINYLIERGVIIEPFGQQIAFYQDRCTHCGLCVGLCPGEALVMDKISFLVEFKEEACLACGLCVRLCPVKALDIRL